jgi:elongation factor 1-gamma
MYCTSSHPSTCALGTVTVVYQVGGFVQRSGDIRKWAFGVMQITGEEGKELIVSGAWLMRGDTVKHLCDANDDANWYVWQY